METSTPAPPLRSVASSAWLGQASTLRVAEALSREERGVRALLGKRAQVWGYQRLLPSLFWFPSPAHGGGVRGGGHPADIFFFIPQRETHERCHRTQTHQRT